MKELGQEKNDTKDLTNKSDVPKWKRDLDEKIKSDPRLQAWHDEIVKERSAPLMSEDELRRYYKRLLYDRQHEGGAHADWAYIMKWLNEHPKKG